MKSIKRSSHGWDDTGNGHSRPLGFAGSYFISWQSKQLATKFRVSTVIVFQMKFSATRSKVLRKSLWHPVGDWWNSESNVLINEQSEGNQMRPRHKMKWGVNEWSGYAFVSERILSFKVTNSWFVCNSLRKSSRKVKCGTERMKSEAVVDPMIEIMCLLLHCSCLLYIG